MGKIIGIDLGTTNSVAFYLSAGNPTAIPNAQGSNLTPSVVTVDDKGNIIVGMPAKNQSTLNPENTIYSVKRLIGRRWTDDEVQKDIKNLPFHMREAKNGGVEVKMGDKWYTPQEISAKVLAKIKTDAESYLGESVTQAVITVPAYFDDSQRQATKDAGRIAGLEVLRIINEPTAAALAYGMKDSKDKKIAVFDLGGGTFDVSILETGDNVFEVLSTNGDTHLGGDDFDRVIINLLADDFQKEHNIDLRTDRVALQRLREAAEKAKIELSFSETADINLSYITADSKGQKHLVRTITRAEMEKAIAPLLDRLVEPCKKAIADSGLSKEDISDVLLVGGMTRMPIVQKKAKDIFGKDPIKGVNPDEAVAIGAAIQGGVLGGEVTDITLIDVTPLSLGIEVNGGEMKVMIPRNTAIPTEKSDDSFTTAVDNQPAVDVRVFQGERPMTADNKLLGVFRLDVLPARRGVPRIEVTFKLDANGILSVTAKDKATNKENSITITSSTGLSEADIQKMIEEAEKNAASDKEKKEKAQIKNDAESAVYSAERLVEDNKDTFKPEDKEKLEKISSEIKDLLSKEDIDYDGLKSKTEDLTKEIMRISEDMYKAKANTETDSSDAEAEASKASNPTAPEVQDGKVVE